MWYANVFYEDWSIASIVNDKTCETYNSLKNGIVCKLLSKEVHNSID